MFQDYYSAQRAKKFIDFIQFREKQGTPLYTRDWKKIIMYLDTNQGSFYAMRDRLQAAGLIQIKKGRYYLSSQFSIDLIDLAKFWYTAILEKKDFDNLVM